MARRQWKPKIPCSDFRISGTARVRGAADSRGSEGRGRSEEEDPWHSGSADSWMPENTQWKAPQKNAIMEWAQAAGIAVRPGTGTAVLLLGGKAGLGHQALESLHHREGRPEHQGVRTMLCLFVAMPLEAKLVRLACLCMVAP